VPVDRIVEKEVTKEVYVTDDEVTNKLQKELESVKKNEKVHLKGLRKKVNELKEKDGKIDTLNQKISDLEGKLELEIKTSNVQVEINKELVEVKNSLFDELEKKKEELDESIEDWGADVTTLTNNLESTIEEKNKIVSDYDVKIDTLNRKISDLTNEVSQLEKDLEKKTDDKYKKFWEDEIESHDKTKEEINVLKETINQLKGNTSNGDDIYGSDEKGWWSGGRVDWEDYPENRTVESKNRVKSYFSKKYGVPTTSIKINFIPIIKNKEGKTIDISDGLIENIMDEEYQRKLFAEWLKRNETNVDFTRLCKLDDKINEVLFEGDVEDYRYRRWELKKLWIDNFLSYGDNNDLDYSKLKGLNVVKSEPANQGGKTIFSIDALLFLFFGKTTKTDVALENFNQFRDKNEVVVGGLITIDGEDYIIERTIKRKAKKAGGYSASNSLDFYKLLADGNKENLEGEQRRETDKLITETIGSYDDFMTTIVATAGNLESLIGTKPTERGRLLTKFIGLEVIEKKEAINKKMMSDYKSSMKSNIYNLKDLNDDITEHEESIVTNKGSIETNRYRLLIKKMK
jgi:DNA repair exonuclease SbcCD ATPase subunit